MGQTSNQNLDSSLIGFIDGPSANMQPNTNNQNDLADQSLLGLDSNMQVEQ